MEEDMRRPGNRRDFKDKWERAGYFLLSKQNCNDNVVHLTFVLFLSIFFTNINVKKKNFYN